MHQAHSSKLYKLILHVHVDLYVLIVASIFHISSIFCVAECIMFCVAECIMFCVAECIMFV